MAETLSREERLHEIRMILAEKTVPSQDMLAELLRRRGHGAAQSSISRDLRELGVAKVGGAYRLPPLAEAREVAGSRQTLRDFLRHVVPAGPHLLVAHTVVGGASRVGLALDELHWPEILGTVAGDDTLLLAIPGRREQKRLLQRLRPYEEGSQEA